MNPLSDQSESDRIVNAIVQALREWESMGLKDAMDSGESASAAEFVAQRFGRPAFDEKGELASDEEGGEP